MRRLKRVKNLITPNITNVNPDLNIGIVNKSETRYQLI